jgi:tRNA 2-thiouridine synthesizing protein A
LTERTFEALVDARGLACPMPLVKARQALMVLDPGTRICVLATDPAAPADFEEFCLTAGHELIATDEAEGIFKILLAKRR